MATISAGIVLYRRKGDIVEVLLVHPGGPLWAKKDEGAWSIPKGLVEEGEDLFKAACREFEEETGLELNTDRFIHLGPVKLKSGKVVHAFAVEGNCDPAKIRSNTFEMEWPPRSGKVQNFPEIDRAAWFRLDEAKRKINPGQVRLIEELERIAE
jgi:predicted NUDIX family NTP pyrophosphohydrolase